MVKVKNILFIGTELTHLKNWSEDDRTEVISSINFLDSVIMSFTPDLIIFDSMNNTDVRKIRESEKLVRVPVLIIEKSFAEVNNLNLISDYPKVLICNKEIAQTVEFYKRISSIIEKRSKILPPRTGITIKYAILYINKNVSKPLNRGMVASQVGVAEDYLSKIFHAEMGISLWNYINQYRLYVAHRLLLETGIPLTEISAKVGYSSASYFNKAYKKLYGYAPGAIRKEEI